jgi:hypothetical protein
MRSWHSRLALASAHVEAHYARRLPGNPPRFELLRKLRNELPLPGRGRLAYRFRESLLNRIRFEYLPTPPQVFRRIYLRSRTYRFDTVTGRIDDRACFVPI